LARRRQQRDIVDGHVGLALGPHAAGEFRASADRASFVIKLSRCDVPALVDFTDHGVVTEFEVVEELLTEFDRAVDLLDAPQRDAGAADRHQKHRQALVLWHVPVGARE